jgi:hypothetical protein
VTIGSNPLDLLVPAQPVAAMAGSGRAKPAERDATTVLTVTVPVDLAERLEQVISVTPGLDLDTLATEALELVWAKLRKPARPATVRIAAKPAAKPKSKAKPAKPESKAKAKSKPKGRDASGVERKLVVIVGE